MGYEFVWVASDGRIVELNEASGFQPLLGVAGLDAPPVELSVESRTAGDGSVLVKRRTSDRFVTLPLYVNTGSDVRSAISTLSDVFRGPGTLRVSDDDGATFRDLRDVYYETGLEGDESGDVSLPGVWRKAVVSLQALDPWWYASEVAQAIELGGVTAFDAVVAFDDASTQFNGGDSTLFAVGGHADAFPVWTIVGPFTTLTIEVAGRGQFTLSSALAGGSTLTIDTRPSTRGPRLNAGGVNWGLLTADSRLPLLPNGSAAVSLSATGSDPGWASDWNLSVGSGDANTSGAAVFTGGILYLNDLDADGVDRSAVLASVIAGDRIEVGSWAFEVTAPTDNSTHWSYTGTVIGTAAGSGRTRVERDGSTITATFEPRWLTP